MNILVVGCGNSKMSEGMIDDGFQNIMNIDFSKNVIDKMTEHYAEKMPQLKFQQADVRNLQGVFESGTFDAVIDKACFDAILCGDYSVANSKLFLAEIERVLKYDGVYVSITYGVPDNRQKYFVPKNAELYTWGSTVQIMRVAKITQSTKEAISTGEKIDKDDGKFFHYVYIMKKEGAPEPVEKTEDDA